MKPFLGTSPRDIPNIKLLIPLRQDDRVEIVSTHMSKQRQNYKWLHKLDVQLSRLHLPRDARLAN